MFFFISTTFWRIKIMWLLFISRLSIRPTCRHRYHAPMSPVIFAIVQDSRLLRPRLLISRACSNREWIFFGCWLVTTFNNFALRHNWRHPPSRQSDVRFHFFSLFFCSFCRASSLSSSEAASAALAVVRCLAWYMSRSCIVSKRLKYGHSCYVMQMCNRTKASKWYHFQWSWVTPKLHFKVSTTETARARPLCDSWASCLAHAVDSAGYPYS